MSTPMSRRLPVFVRAAAVLAMALLYLPLGAVAMYSLNRARVGLVWEGFTLEWYRRLLENAMVLGAAANTLVLALISTAIATVLGTLLGVGLEGYPWPRPLRRLLDAVVDLPVVTPDVIFAAALVVVLTAGSGLGSWFGPGLPAMVMGHVTFQIPFIALLVRSRLTHIGRTLGEAAHDLYAGRVHTFRRVTLPLLWPAIAGGALLAFTLSLDDFVISFFAAGPGTTTLPIAIYAALRRGLSPELHALSTLIVVMTVLAVVVLERVTRGVRGSGGA